MKPTMKESGNASARRPRVRVIQKLMTVPAVKGVIEMRCEIQGGGMVSSPASQQPVAKMEKKPSNGKTSTNTARAIEQDTFMKPEYEAAEKKTVQLRRVSPFKGVIGKSMQINEESKVE